MFEKKSIGKDAIFFWNFINALAFEASVVQKKEFENISLLAENPTEEFFRNFIFRLILDL